MGVGVKVGRVPIEDVEVSDSVPAEERASHCPVESAIHLIIFSRARAIGDTYFHMSPKYTRAKLEDVRRRLYQVMLNAAPSELNTPSPSSGCMTDFEIGPKNICQ